MGWIEFPSNVVAPQTAVLGSLSSTGKHGVRGGPVTVLDSRTIEIRDFSYDGRAPG